MKLIAIFTNHARSEYMVGSIEVPGGLDSDTFRPWAETALRKGFKTPMKGLAQAFAILGAKETNQPPTILIIVNKFSLTFTRPGGGTTDWKGSWKGGIKEVLSCHVELYPSRPGINEVKDWRTRPLPA